MRMSESIKELALALSKFQEVVKDPEKKTSAHKNKYADLQEVLEVCRPLLAKFGLSVSQSPGGGEGYISVDTLLMHTSGEWICSTVKMEFERMPGLNLPQSTGCYITYGRRYGVAAILGISQQDEDGADIKSGTNNQKYAKKPEYVPQEVPKITKEEAAHLRGLISHNPTPYLIRMRQAFNVGSIEELEPAQYIKMVDKLREEGLADQKLEKVA